MDTEERNKEIVRRFVRAANARDYEALAAVVSPSVERHCQATPEVEVRSFEDFRQFLEREAETFPDNRVTLETLVAEGDLVAVWATYTATQSGPMGPFPSSEKRMSVEFGGVLRIEDGKIQHIRVIWDNVAALVQLGHFAPAGSPPSGTT